jgi:hypothetical protein
MGKTPAELHAELVIEGDIVRFQEWLNTETEDGRIKILMSLLADEFEKFKLGATQ